VAFERDEFGFQSADIFQWSQTSLVWVFGCMFFIVFVLVFPVNKYS